MPVIPVRFKAKLRATAVRKATRVYAIAFDIDSAIAEKHCGQNWRGTCYAKIASVLAEFGFTRVQGSVYFGEESSEWSIASWQFKRQTGVSFGSAHRCEI